MLSIGWGFKPKRIFFPNSRILKKGSNAMKPRELVLALRAMGLTQKQIEQRTGIPQPTVSKIGLGRVGDVMSRHYLALLAAYEQRMKEEALKPSPQGFRQPSINE